MASETIDWDDRSSMSSQHEYFRVVCRQCANKGTLHHKSDDRDRWEIDMTEGFRVLRPRNIPTTSKLKCDKCGSENVEIEQKPCGSGEVDLES